MWDYRLSDKRFWNTYEPNKQYPHLPLYTENVYDETSDECLCLFSWLIEIFQISYQEIKAKHFHLICLSEPMLAETGAKVDKILDICRSDDEKSHTAETMWDYNVF